MSKETNYIEFNNWIENPTTKKFVELLKKLRLKKLHDLSLNFRDLDKQIEFGKLEQLKDIIILLEEAEVKKNLEEILDIYNINLLNLIEYE